MKHGLSFCANMGLCGGLLDSVLCPRWWPICCEGRYQPIFMSGGHMSAAFQPVPDPLHQGTFTWLPTRGDARLLMEASGDSVFVTDRDGRILSLNRMAQELVGSARDVIGQSFHDLLGCRLLDLNSGEVCPLAQMLKTGEVAMLVSQLWTRGDGAEYELSTSFWPRMHEGERIGAVIVARDLTAAIEAQRDVQRVAGLAEDAPNPIVEFDVSGSMLFANRAMVELMAQCGGIQGGGDALMPGNLSEILAECLRTRQAAAQIEHTVCNRVLAWSFCPLGELDQVRAYGIDITADVELRRAKEAAEESARAKGIFLATMSHELRTPMNGVLGCTQLLQDTSLTDVQHQLIQTMHRSAEALLVLVNDILDFSKIEAGKMTLEVADLELRSLIEDVVTLVSGLAKAKSLSLTVQVAPHLPGTLRGDPVRLRQILFNLVGNAIKFTKAGSVAISVTSRPAPAHLTDSILLEWSIADTGIGMTPEQQARLFQPYSQAETSTARKFGGTGLGLMICRQLVELMGGEIVVDSMAGNGTTFRYTTLVLPSIQREGGEQASATEEPAPVASSNGLKRILVADDNDINRLVACKFLQKLGYETGVARNGMEAVDALAREAYDAVLMDCEMPEMDGYEATRVIRQHGQRQGRSLPIIALTGHASPEDERICREAGMDAVVTKPVTLPALRAILNRTFSRPLSE